MKIICLILIIFFIGCSQTVYEKESDYQREGPFKVIKTIDGDTADLNNSYRIRFSGINTPEKKKCYYKEAKDRLAELILNKDVYIEMDYTNIDKYNRYLRYVYVDDILVNGVMVREGYAKVFDKYKEDTRKYAELKKLEIYAIKNNLGVWNCSD
ncbi:MAG: thermonuclease family protein [Candidatus Nanoarchaeia archaeon]|nr:thermonuclease family protein [Candidatus Nanoarchaeia archaeon]